MTEREDHRSSTSVSTLKELWERTASLETNVKAALKCNDAIKNELNSIQQDLTVFGAFKESTSHRFISLDRRMGEFEKGLDKLEITKAEIAAVREATTLAKENVDMRLASMNEFRDALKDQASGFLPRGEFTARMVRNDEDIRLLRESRAELLGKASQTSVIVAYLISAIGIAIAVVAMFIR